MYKKFLKRGFPVFGIRPILDGGRCQCSPECTKAGKHPWDKNWEDTPAWSIEKLEQEEQRGRLKNGYGVLMSGLLVVDVDAKPGKGGHESELSLLELIPEIKDAGLIVRSGSGGESKHYYFTVDKENPLRGTLPDYPGIDFKSSGYVVGPGSQHVSGGTYDIISGSPEEIGPVPRKLLELLIKPDSVRLSGNVDISIKEIADMLDHIDPDCEEPTWRLIGGAIHHLTSGSPAGFELFDYWSSQGDKYDGRASCLDKWKRYGNTPNPAGIGTLRHLAHEGGYDEPVTYVCDIDWGHVPGFDDDPEKFDETPCNIDLQRPAGFVGEVADWIEGQSIKSMERTSTAAALTVVGNVAGLQYEDDLPYGTTSNLFTICIAASGRGKGFIKNAISDLHRVAGMGRVTFGKSKSAQEIYRALMRNQSCLFNIDELGIKFVAIANASKSGASFYETWFAEMMSIYSSANGVVDLQEDDYRDIEKHLVQEITAAREKVQNNEDPNGKYKNLAEKLEAKLNGNLGLVRPFLSMIGYSTPERFDSMVTPDRVTEGFIGRCLIVREPVDRVTRKRNFQPTKAIPERIKNTLIALSTGGRAGEDVDVLSNHGSRIRIKTTAEAREEFDRLIDVFEEMEERYEVSNGMHAIPTRGEELVAKISFILAIPEGVRTLDHVKWATAYVMRDIETKVNLAVGNSQNLVKSEEALQSRILANVTPDTWVTTAQLRNRCRPIALDALTLALYKMRDKKMLIEGEQPDRRSPKKTVQVWKLR